MRLQKESLGLGIVLTDLSKSLVHYRTIIES